MDEITYECSLLAFHQFADVVDPLERAYLQITHSYREVFAGPGWRALAGTVDPRPQRPSVRDQLIEAGFATADVDALIARKDAEMVVWRREQRAREAYERTRRYRVRKWLSVRRERLATATEVLRGEHECGGDEW